MSEYDLGLYREMFKYVCGISFLIVATCLCIVVFFNIFPFSIIETILDILSAAFLVSGVVSGWIIVIIDFIFMTRGIEDDR